MEEFFFIKGVSKYGIGNWEEISKCIGTKNEMEVENHFYGIFSIPKDPYFSSEKKNIEYSNPYKGSVSIYMPNRKDFDIEYLNEFEEKIKDIEFTENDDEVEREIKECMLNIYIDIMDMREYRKFVILDRGLINMKEVLRKDKINEKLNLYSYRFLLPILTSNDYNKFIEGIHIENTLLSRIKSCGKPIDKSKFNDYRRYLSSEEKEFTYREKITSKEFFKLKKYALKCFIENKGFFDEFQDNFDYDEIKANTFYEYFKNQGYFFDD